MAWDKTKPAGSRALNQVDNDLRDNNDAIEAAIAQDHDFVTGSTQTGKHKQTTFKAVLSTKPSLAAGEGALYTKSYNSKTELFYEDNNGSEFLVMVPVGTILPFMPGYFTNGSNAGYTYQLGSANTVAAINTLLNTYGWYVCNGAALNLSTSPIFNGASRYLPNLTDDRFLMGDTVAGGIGGANSSNLAHTHTTGDFTLTAAYIPSHTHTFTTSSDGAHSHTVSYLSNGILSDIPRLTYVNGQYQTSTWTTSTASAHTHTGTTSAIGSGTAHNHGATGSGGSAAQENRPSYLSCLYIMRVH